MTISSTTRKAGPFPGNGVTVAFPFAYKVFSAADVLVVQAVTATGVETTKVLTTDYTVALNADQNANPGGTVTMLVAPVAGTTLTLASQVSNLQPTDLTNAGGFYPTVINAALDRCVIQIQQLAEKLGRTLSISISSSSSSSSGQLPAPVALALLGWNSTATAIQNFAGTASVAVSSFMATVVSAVDAATARASLGAAASGPLATSGITGVSPRATRINVASVAGTVDLTANAPNTDDIQITGALAITGFTVATDRVLRVTAGGAFTLANGAGLVTQTGANIVAAAGDTFMLRATAANVVEVLNYVPAVAAVQKIANVRQTVLSGPVDTNGLPSFGGATGSTTVTAAGTLVATAANGFGGSGPVDRVGSILNPSWTGLSTNGTMYMYLDIAADGTCTPGSTTLSPTYRWGGADVVTNGQFTFNIQQMLGKVGNGATATQAYRVFVGEVTVAGAVVTAITWYALMGKYRSANVAGLPAASAGLYLSHNIGCEPQIEGWKAICTSTDGGFAVGDVYKIAAAIWTNGTAAVTPQPFVSSLLWSIGIWSAMTSWQFTLRTNGAITTITPAKWSYYVEVQRGW